MDKQDNQIQEKTSAEKAAEVIAEKVVEIINREVAKESTPEDKAAGTIAKQAIELIQSGVSIKKEIPEGKAEYLQLIQEPISRMSTISSIFKGFAATIVAGIALISYSTTSKWVLLCAFIPVIVFAILDMYYLNLERQFRWLYKQVSSDKHGIDFSMKRDIKCKKEAKTRIRDCIKSFSIWPFYLAMITILTGVFILKWNGII